MTSRAEREAVQGYGFLSLPLTTHQSTPGRPVARLPRARGPIVFHLQCVESNVCGFALEIRWKMLITCMSYPWVLCTLHPSVDHDM